MSKRYRKTPASPRWKPKRLKERRAPTPPAAEARPTRVKFYGGQFTPDELALIAACVQDLQLEDEVWMQRVLNLRLLRVAGQLDESAQAEAATAGAPPSEGEARSPADTAVQQLVHVAQALTAGAGRLARLLHDERLLSGEMVNQLAQGVAMALEEFHQQIGANNDESPDPSTHPA
jgi:hypothetical protein